MKLLSLLFGTEEDFVDPEKMSLPNGEVFTSNSCFDTHVSHSRKAFCTELDSEFSKDYNGRRDKKLLKECRKHQKKFNNPKKSNNTLFLVHPCYTEFKHKSFLNEGSKMEDFEKYSSSLRKLLERNKAGMDLDIVMLDTIHFYSVFTNILNQWHFVDKVIFTEYDRGSLFQNTKQYLEFREDSNVYFAGGYDNRCLSSAVSEFSKRNPEIDICGVKEITIGTPLSTKTLFPKRYTDFDEKQFISVNHLLEKHA